MAKNKSTVYLGYEDEEVTEKHKALMNFTVNKVGGLPDWPGSDITIPSCPICGLSRPLILQIYAPLENSQFHRTFFIFACLNSSCSIQSKCWLCIRTQNLDKSQEIDTAEHQKSNISSVPKITWCNGADDWDVDVEDSQSEENGNVVYKNDNCRMSDDDDESNSMENDIIGEFGNLQVADDKNANCGAQGGAPVQGAFGTVDVPTVFAEIEGEESELVTAETPQAPERDLIALLKQTSGISSNLSNLVLKSFFVAVDEEYVSASSNYSGLTEHVRELYQEYQARDESLRLKSPGSPSEAGARGGSYTGNSDCEPEVYEKTLPAHGDIMFHNFLTTIQNNPGQILRYTRDTLPLLIAPLAEPIPKCQNCGSDCICEIQILSTLIPKLRLENNDPAPIEYGNVLIYTCLKSCWDTPDKMRYETILIQQEG